MSCFFSYRFKLPIQATNSPCISLAVSPTLYLNQFSFTIKNVTTWNQQQQRLWKQGSK